MQTGYMSSGDYVLRWNHKSSKYFYEIHLFSTKLENSVEVCCEGYLPDLELLKETEKLQ